MITNKTGDIKTSNFLTGEAILIDKPHGWSSFKAVHYVRKACGVRKVGHAGTLDPLATGLLILCTGKMTKSITSFQDMTKTYTGSIRLGGSTPSMDLETEIIDSVDISGISEDQILSARDTFIGDIMQTPPMYSAINHNGKKLYELARKGKTVEIAPRQVKVLEFLITEIKLPEIYFSITCTKGTYIRVIADDLGKMLGCGAVLSSLRRTKIGDFSVDDALLVPEFEQLFMVPADAVQQ